MSIKFTSVPPKSLSQAILANGTSFIPNNIKGWDDVDLTSADFGTRAFGAFINANRTRLELFEWDPSTIASASISIVYRGLKFDGTQVTEVTANKFDWPATGTTILLGSDVPQLFGFLLDLFSNQSVSGVKTFVSSPVVPTPVNGTDAANKDYVNSVVAGIATTVNVIVPGNAGETVAAGNLVYYDDTDNEWKKCDADTASTVENQDLGIAQGAGTNGNAIAGGVLVRGLDSNQTGLTAGIKYYASNTAGGISSTPGTKEVTLGFSYSTTQLYFNPRFDQQLTEDQQDALVGTVGTPSATNKYVTNDDTTGTGSVVRQSLLSAITKFGGTGSDGALNVTSGTTTIDLGGVNVFIKNYTSINVSAGATLDFSNPASDGTIIIFKSQGTVTFAGTVDIRNLGSTAGSGGSVGNPGSAGSVPFGNVFSNTAALAGANTPTGSGQETVSTTTLSAVTRNQNTLYSKFIALTVGGGGGGGYGGGTSATGGNGGRGAGSMYIESLGVLSITGTIQATGAAGSNAVAGTNDSGGGGGGGGAGGQFIVLYNSTVTDSGTYNFSGGVGGNGSAAGGGSGGGGASGGQGGGNAYPGGAGGRYRGVNGNTGNTGATGGNSGGTGGTGGTAATASGGSGGGGGAGGFYLVTPNTEFN